MSSVVAPYLLAELKRRGGQANEKELYESVTKLLKADDSMELTLKEFNKLLLVLETRGLVRVSFMKKNLRVVQIVPPHHLGSPNGGIPGGR